MKQATLLAAAHNAADSLSSGCAIAFGLLHFPFWKLLKALPEPVLRVDLLTGNLMTSRPSGFSPEWEKLQNGFAIAGGQMSEFLRSNGCDPTLIESIVVEFRIVGPSGTYQAEVTARQITGEESSETYSGAPLKRRKVVDHLGRIRKG